MATKRTTKKDLETKIAELESKIAQLSSQVSTKPSTQAPQPKQTQTQQTPPPPKAQTPPPKQTPPQKQTQAPPTKPVWEQWQDTPMGNWNIQKTKVPGYVSAPNRYYASKVVQRADVPTSDWNLQKPKVPGYTQPSNKYFATRSRLAYHPTPKRFAGYGISGPLQVQTAPRPKAKPHQGSLPKGF